MLKMTIERCNEVWPIELTIAFVKNNQVCSIVNISIKKNLNISIKYLRKTYNTQHGAINGRTAKCVQKKIIQFFPLTISSISHYTTHNNRKSIHFSRYALACLLTFSLRVSFYHCENRSMKPQKTTAIHLHWIQIRFKIFGSPISCQCFLFIWFSHRVSAFNRHGRQKSMCSKSLCQ